MTTEAVDAHGARRYALYASALSLVAALLVLPLALVLGRDGQVGYLAGWALMAVVGVAGGSALVARHGGSGPLFVTVVIACMLARLLGVMVGAVLLWWTDRSPTGFLIGVAVGFIPLQFFEAIWFYRTGRGAALEALMRMAVGRPAPDGDRIGRKTTG